MLDRFDEPGAVLPVVEGLQDRDVDIDRRRVPEGPEGVLADARIHAGLAADGGIGLGQRRRRDLDDGDAALEDRRREAGDVAHRPAAQGDDHRIPAEIGLLHRLDDRDRGVDGLGDLARGLDGEIGSGSAAEQGVQMARGDQVLIGDDEPIVFAVGGLDLAPTPRAECPTR